jgi:hypothetical protein
MAELAVNGFATANLVDTVEITGTAQTLKRWPGANQNLSQLAADWVARDLAEPDVLEAFKFLDANPNVRPAGDLLFALAGNAELSGAKDWLSLGGRVAVVARPNPAAWQSLIEHAERSGGTLLVPVLRARSTEGSLAERAGLDLVQDVEAIASWLHQVSRSASRVVIASYAYIGGSNQIIAQAAQDALIAAASKDDAWRASQAKQAEVMMSLARESGHRTKIAVKANDPAINAKGACIGELGRRVRAVTEELNDEKIDIVDYSETISDSHERLHDIDNVICAENW